MICSALLLLLLFFFFFLLVCQRKFVKVCKVTAIRISVHCHFLPHPSCHSAQSTQSFPLFIHSTPQHPALLLLLCGSHSSSTLYSGPTKLHCNFGVTLLQYFYLCKMDILHSFTRYALNKRSIGHVSSTVNIAPGTTHCCTNYITMYINQ